MLGIGLCLARLARVATEHVNPEQAARLLGAAATLRKAVGTLLATVDRAEYDRNLAAVRAQLGEDACPAAQAAGQALMLEQAVAEALNR